MRLGIHGVQGRMGLKVLAGALCDKSFSQISGYARNTTYETKEYTPLDSLEELADNSDVIIDFSSPLALNSLLQIAVERKTPLVIGTTGLSKEIIQHMEESAKQIPILYAANFSLGVAACTLAAEILFQKLSTEFQTHIIETHHIHKKDSPSGTALAFSEVMENTPPIESIRSGEVIGKHQIFFSNEQEVIQLSHEALSRDTFAKGALFAAKALVLSPPGLYSLKDILGMQK
ncbi:MAG: 4-hydroxy-tetrahydrodipicolinate reductase [Chlamydiae bacterium]|nr:4-hydroxy-tetrahydrodipicolinate reductase [Chlamydiota bacterium]